MRNFFIFLRAGIPGSRKPRDPATLVGTDSTAPAGAFRRPKTAGPTLRPEISARFAAAQGSAGGPWPSPTTGRSPRPTGKRHSHVITNLCRGRCSHRPGNPAAARTSAGGYGIRPYSQRQGPRPTGKRHSRVITNLCRGRCLHRPGNRAAARTPAGGINPAPTAHGQRPANWNGRVYPGVRRAGCPHPAAPRGAANTPGRIWNPPLRIHFVFWAKREGRRQTRCPRRACAQGFPQQKGTVAKKGSSPFSIF